MIQLISVFNKVGAGYILVCSIFKWNWLGLQVYLNIPLSGELYIVYFGTIYTHSQIQCTSIKMDYSTRIMPRVIRPEFPSIGLRCILEVLTNSMTATFTQYETNETFMSRNEERSIYTQHSAHANIKVYRIAIELV